jgi:hypothetical protein
MMPPPFSGDAGRGRVHASGTAACLLPVFLGLTTGLEAPEAGDIVGFGQILNNVITVSMFCFATQAKGEKGADAAVCRSVLRHTI